MNKSIKRIFDLILAIVLIIPASFILFIGIIIVKIVSPESSPIYKQKRVGYKGQHFMLIKLRSMTNECDANGNLLLEEKRLKKWGKIIRATNIDELLQIINIIKGEMSFIGPRPILQEEMLVMTEIEQVERQSMRPGITGWEAIHEGLSKNRREMAEFDLYYVRNWTLKMDWLILFKTIKIIMKLQRPNDLIRAPKMNDNQIYNKH